VRISCTVPISTTWMPPRWWARSVRRRHAPAVHALARRLLGPVTLASEAAQEVFLRLWDRPERFDPARDRCGRSCSRRPSALEVGSAGDAA
jgi:hypothetical protein